MGTITRRSKFRKNPKLGLKFGRGARANLPAQLTLLIGRENEVVAGCKLLQRPDVRLLTFTGPAGVGKTRLALEVAKELLGEFEDRVSFIPLATIRTPDLVISTIARALGLREASRKPAFERLQAYLQDKRLLLLLDNF